MTRSLTAAITAGLLVFWSSAPSSAQTPRRLSVAAIFGAFVVDSDPVRGASSHFGVAGSMRLTERLDVEVELDRPRNTFFREYTGTSISFAAPGASREEIERLAVVTTFSYERRVLHTISGGIVFSGRLRGRWTPRLYAGVTNHHVDNVSRTTPISLPAGVDPDKLARVRPEEWRSVRNLGALTGGVGVRLTLTPHLSLDPDLRFDYGSIGDEIENAIRPSLRLVWSF
jgi:hypothetical protein